MDSPPSRRVFIQRLTFLGGGVVLLYACKDDKPAPAANIARAKGLTTSHKTFTNDEWAVLVAACDRILPKDEDAGAVEAGVPEYIDRMLQSPELTKMRDEFLPGLAALDRRATRETGKGFAEATDAQKDALLEAFRQSGRGTGEAHFFELLTVLTLEGFLGDPSYGGNKDRAGWKLVGFQMVGTQAAEPQPGYDGVQHLHHHHGGG